MFSNSNNLLLKFALQYPVLVIATVIPEIVAAAYIVVVPQRDTPVTRAQFPLKLTDGIAMAKPVLATRVGDIPEILGGTGYLVEPSCPNQIVEKIQWMFHYLEEAQEQGKRARVKMCKILQYWCNGKYTLTGNCQFIVNKAC